MCSAASSQGYDKAISRCIKTWKDRKVDPLAEIWREVARLKPLYGLTFLAAWQSGDVVLLKLVVKLDPTTRLTGDVGERISGVIG